MRLEPPLVWEQRIMHKLVEKHRVEPGEVEEVFFDNRPLFRRYGEIYHVYGQSITGRYLFVVFRYLGAGKAKPITAYTMTEKQRRYYQRTKGEM
jgi:uncharacterized DUF497 family protein